MNLQCVLCGEEAILDCGIVKNLICDGCCWHDLRQIDAPEYIKSRYNITKTWTEIIDACSRCRHKQA